MEQSATNTETDSGFVFHMPNRAASLTNERLCNMHKMIPREKHLSLNPRGLTEHKDRNLPCKNCTRQRDQISYIRIKTFLRHIGAKI